MTDDRELLELAAKAAGIHCKGWAMPGGRSDGWQGMYTGSDDDGAYVRWNPLADDGDALRLAVKLGMHVMVYADECHAVVWGDGTASDRESTETNKRDPLSATRRAIVRAAAEIGKGMK